MLGLANRSETLIFMSLHFEETLTILISHFLHFGALRIFTDYCFVMRVNKMVYSKQKYSFYQIHIYASLWSIICDIL